MTPLVTYYQQLLESVGCIISDTGTVLIQPDLNKPPVPVTVKVDKKEKTLVLPTKALLRDGDWSQLVAFHPACERILSGQSEVLNAFTHLAARKLHDTVQLAVASISELGLNKAVHGKLSLAQKELLISCDGIDATVAKLLIDIAKRNTGIVGKHPLLSLRLEHGGEIDDEVFSRTCHLMTHVINGKDNFCGVTSSSIKAKRIVKNLYEYVFPTTRVTGSNSKDTPYLFALLDCYYITAKHLNGIRHTLGKYSAMREIPIAWHETMKDLRKLANRYLAQPMAGNTGLAISAHKPPEEVAEVVPTVTQYRQPVGAPAVPVTTASPAAGPALTKSGIVCLATAPKVAVQAPMAPAMTLPSNPTLQLTPQLQSPPTTAQLLAAQLRNQQHSQYGGFQPQQQHFTPPQYPQPQQQYMPPQQQMPQTQYRQPQQGYQQPQTNYPNSQYRVR